MLPSRSVFSSRGTAVLNSLLDGWIAWQGEIPRRPTGVLVADRTGETTAYTLNHLLDIANSLDKRTARQLELFVRLLEPIMLLVMAGVTLLVCLGLLLPVFKMSSTVK